MDHTDWLKYVFNADEMIENSALPTGDALGDRSLQSLSHAKELYLDSDVYVFFQHKL